MVSWESDMWVKEPLFFFFLDFIYFYCKVRYTERRRDRVEDLPTNDSFHKWPQCPVLCRSEAMSQELPPSLPRGYRVSIVWAVLDCFPRPQVRSWMENELQILEPESIWDPGSFKPRTLAARPQYQRQRPRQVRGYAKKVRATTGMQTIYGWEQAWLGT